MSDSPKSFFSDYFPEMRAGNHNFNLSFSYELANHLDRERHRSLVDNLLLSRSSSFLMDLSNSDTLVPDIMNPTVEAPNLFQPNVTQILNWNTEYINRNPNATTMMYQPNFNLPSKTPKACGLLSSDVVINIMMDSGTEDLKRNPYIMHERDDLFNDLLKQTSGNQQNSMDMEPLDRCPTPLNSNDDIKPKKKNNRCPPLKKRKALSQKKERLTCVDNKQPKRQNKKQGNKSKGHSKAKKQSRNTTKLINMANTQAETNAVPRGVIADMEDFNRNPNTTNMVHQMINMQAESNAEFAYMEDFNRKRNAMMGMKQQGLNMPPREMGNNDPPRKTAMDNIYPPGLTPKSQNRQKIRNTNTNANDLVGMELQRLNTPPRELGDIYIPRVTAMQNRYPIFNMQTAPMANAPPRFYPENINDPPILTKEQVWRNHPQIPHIDIQKAAYNFGEACIGHKMVNKVIRGDYDRFMGVDLGRDEDFIKSLKNGLSQRTISYHLQEDFEIVWRYEDFLNNEPANLEDNQNVALKKITEKYFEGDALNWIENDTRRKDLRPLYREEILNEYRRGINNVDEFSLEAFSSSS